MRGNWLLFMCMALPSVAFSAEEGTPSPRFGQGDGYRAKNIERTVDPVISKGKEMPGLKGLFLEGFRLFAFHDNRWEPIPFQIDEIDEDGLYVLPLGKRPNEDKGKGQLPERLDDNDELVFMAMDFGDKAPKGKWPVKEGHGVEIEVRDPITGGKGWTYLFWSKNPPPRSDRDYVRFDPREDRVYAECYTLGYSTAKDLVYTTFLTVAPKGGGTGTELLDRINIRFSATILLKSITFSRNEDDFVSEVIAYKDGPVRVMRRVANSIRLVLGIQSPKIIAYSVYYRDAIETPNILHLPVGLGSVAKSINFEGGSDYSHNAIGMQFYSSNNPQGVVADGRMSPQELAMDYGEHAWTMISGPQGHIMARLEMGPGFKEVLGKELMYIDDIMRSNAPEDEPGQTPKIGFSFTNILALKKGTYYYNVRFYFPSFYKLGQEKPYLDILDHPLEIRITPIQL
jgi:hypothetical protein